MEAKELYNVCEGKKNSRKEITLRNIYLNVCTMIVKCKID